MFIRQYRKLNLLTEFSNSIFIKFILKLFVVLILFKIHTCTRFCLLYAFYLSFRCKKAKIFQGLYFTREPPSRLCYESVVGLTAPWDSHLHFTTFKNSILVQKIPAFHFGRYCIFVPPLLLLLMTHHEKTQLKAVP